MLRLASLNSSPIRLGCLLGALGYFLGCSSKTENTEPTPSASSISSANTSVEAPIETTRAGEQVTIPAGKFIAGSKPGDEGREPKLEPRPFEVELGEFSIDRLPYPNDPSQPPKTGVTRDQAAKLCAEQDARLCTELEWERACKGPNSSKFPSGNEWSAACAEEPRQCASGFGVLGLGAALKEWTASQLDLDAATSTGILRGAPKGAEAAAHRCAARTTSSPSASSEELGFRCCRGAPNAATIPKPKLGEAFRKIELSGAQLEKLLAAHPTTQGLVHELVFFREPEAAHTVVSRGTGDRKGFNFTVRPLLWNPTEGSEYLVVSARSGKATSFVLAYRVIAEEQYELAGSFIMKNEVGPVALAYSNSIRPRLHFSNCWGCPGETGKLLFRNPDEVVILQP